MIGMTIRAEFQHRGGKPRRANLGASVLLRVVLIAALVFTVCFAVDTPGSLAHTILEGEPAVATASAPIDAAPVLDALKAPAGSHENGPLGAPCNGHCASHAVGLLALPVEAVEVIPTITVWSSHQGQLTDHWSSFTLERPPRV